MMASKPRVASNRGRVPYNSDATSNGMLMLIIRYRVILSVNAGVAKLVTDCECPSHSNDEPGLKNTKIIAST